MSRLGSGRILLLVVAAAAPVLPMPWGMGLLALALLVVGWPASGRRLALSVLLALALVCLSVATVRGWRIGAGQVPDQARLEARYLRFWNGLEGVAASLVDDLPALPGADRGELFLRLQAAVERTGASVLLVDDGGQAAAWAGEGLLHEPSLDAIPVRGATWRAGLMAATLFWAEPIDTADGEWQILVGRSLPTTVLPEFLAPGGAVPAIWTLDDTGDWPFREEQVGVESVGLPTLWFEPPSGASLVHVRRARELPWRRLAAVLVALSLGLASAGVGSPRAPPVRALLVGGALFAAAWAAQAPAIPAVALALSVAALSLVWSELTPKRRGRLVMALAVFGPALLAGGALVARRLLVDPSSPPVLSLTLASALAALAAVTMLGVGHAAESRRVGATRLALAGAIVLLGLACVAAWPFAMRLALVLLAALAAGVWLGPLRGPLAWGRTAGGILVAAAIGGVTWSTLVLDASGPSREYERRPPSEAELAREARRFEEDLERLEVAPWRLGDPAHSDLQDLALGLWQDSRLARTGVMSVLAVLYEGRMLSSFAFGLPTTEEGILDATPARWEELWLPGWEREHTLVRGELEIPGLGRSLELRYWALLRPGFRNGVPLTPDLAAGLLRGGMEANAAVADRQRLLARRSSPQLRPGIGPSPARFLGALGPQAAALAAVDQTARIVLAAAVVGATLLLLSVPLHRLGQSLRRTWSSYSQRLVGVFVFLVLATLFPLQAVLVGMVSRGLEAEQLERGLAALESTQRVLGDYIASLPPGFDVRTALDDELLSWLARVVHHQVNLYWESSVYASSRPELFTAGLLPSRIPGEIYADLALRGTGVALRSNEVGETSYLEIYAPLRVPGMPAQETLFVSIPLLAQQEAVAAQTAALRQRTLLAAAVLFSILLVAGTGLARSFTRPLRSIVDGTREIAAGAEALGVRPGFRELATLAEAIDEMAHRIGEGRRRLLSEKRLVERVVDSVTAAVVSLDAQGRVVLCNRTGRELLGAVPGEDLRETMRAIPSLRPVLEVLDRSPAETQARTVRLAAEGGEAEESEWTVVATALPGEGEPSTLVVVEDVTEVLRGQRLQAWAEMARIIAHEIKNPLTPIRLSAEHLRQVYSVDPDGIGRVLDRCVDNILRQVEDLRQIAAEFATFSQIPRLERRQADLVRVVRDTVDAYAGGAQAGPLVRLATAPADCMLELDARLLGRAVRNLVENAMRAAGQGGRVEVKVVCDGSAASVLVADSGPGVEPRLLPRIFDPYFSTREGGTGLGLPITRRIAEEHGGSLVARNGSDLGGLEVELRIPRDSPPPMR